LIVCWPPRRFGEGGTAQNQDILPLYVTNA
jgi:hypothetical protein